MLSTAAAFSRGTAWGARRQSSGLQVYHSWRHCRPSAGRSRRERADFGRSSADRGTPCIWRQAGRSMALSNQAYDPAR
eukprot:6233355-Pyramimonas_sp.AAC.1